MKFCENTGGLGVSVYCLGIGSVKQEGGNRMALIKTPYNLIYNDDGSLCVTLRKDDVPFPGVKSFAVEEGTMNYFGQYSWNFDAGQVVFFPYALASGKTWADCWDETQKAYIGGQGITVYKIETHTIDLGQIYPAGTKITLSWKHKGCLWFVVARYSIDGSNWMDFNDGDTVEVKGDATLNFWERQGLHIKINGHRTEYYGNPELLLDRWYDVIITYTLPEDTRYLYFIWDFYKAYVSGISGYLNKLQLEIKPFATSFVDGTRPDGRFKINIPITEPFVIAFWRKNNKPTTAAQHDITIQADDYYQDSIASFTYPDNQTQRIVIQKDGAPAANVTIEAFDVDFHDWHFVVFVYDGSVLKIYLNGSLRRTITVSLNLGNFTHIKIGYRPSDLSAIHGMNGLISNLLIAKYDPNIWTDSYIQQLYEARRPFSVPPKLPIV
ncbi:LamG-like jellyroll fold domain-containing protein [Thermosipho melanesiensis]|uniref:LamG domain-containing protein n=3 Tax=Thermosipho melanesiensis TaxID=46541 RepID=A6LMZ3_THEM4|nr:LamG-like jellyroll fold domain-containing protein [Thermosipho melanesiensis]ABR31294.1 hypothetical protein Tmel_1447 [Thermosipho melanesiensis BI429]